MNLHGLVRGVVGAVNPDRSVSVLRSTGYITGSNGKQIPQYCRIDGQSANVQACKGKDIERMNNLGFQGLFRKVYLYGDIVGISRPDGTGGDILKFSQVVGDPAQDWKVVSVEESWSDWCCVIVQLQSTVIP